MRRTDFVGTKFGSSESEGRQKFIPPPIHFLFSPPERSVWRAKRGGNVVIIRKRNAKFLVNEKLQTERNMKNGINKKTVAVGLSGGVDSAVAAMLLKQQNFNVVGVTMKIWPGKPSAEIRRDACFGPGEINNIYAAKKAAKIIGISHKIIDLCAEYQRYVLGYYKKERLAGRTPNPCIVCNQKLKFGFLAQNAAVIGTKTDYFATGHYARKDYDLTRRRWLLLRGADYKKDQSYFLYRLNQTQLKKALFPLGEMVKEDVKEIARANGLEDFANKPESQDFAESNVKNLLLPKTKHCGEIIDINGNIISSHEGYFNFTVGQRQGLKIGGLGEPVYVIDIDPCNNRLIVGKKSEAQKKEFKAGNPHWIALKKLEKTTKAKVRVRSNGELIPCVITPQANKILLIKTDIPQFGIAAGQSAVFYDNDIVLGGGIITSR